MSGSRNTLRCLEWQWSLHAAKLGSAAGSRGPQNLTCLSRLSVQTLTLFRTCSFQLMRMGNAAQHLNIGQKAFGTQHQDGSAIWKYVLANGILRSNHVNQVDMSRVALAALASC